MILRILSAAIAGFFGIATAWGIISKMRHKRKKMEKKGA